MVGTEYPVEKRLDHHLVVADQKLADLRREHAFHLRLAEWSAVWKLVEEIRNLEREVADMRRNKVA